MLTSAAAGASVDEQRDRTAAVLLTVVLAAVFVGLLVQISPSAYLSGDGDWYLRDAADFARGEVARSRYSPGFALFLAPLVGILRGDVAAAGTMALVLNAMMTVGGAVLVFRFLAGYLAVSMAAALAALLAVSQGVAVYAGEVRPEPLALLLAVGALLALRRGHGLVAVTLAGLLVLVRVALAPFVMGVWLVWLARSRRWALLGMAAVGAAVYGHLATQPTVDSSYTDLVATVYDAESGASARWVGLASIVMGNVEAYGRYALPRLAWPYQLLATPLGYALAAAVLVTIGFGLVVLLRRAAAPALRHGGGATLADVHHSDVILVAATVGFGAYAAALLAWPIRDLAAVRMIIPVAFLPLVGLGAGLAALARQAVPSRASRLAATALGCLLVVNAAASTLVVAQRSSDGRLEDFVAVHRAAMAQLPAGPVISTKPAGTELLTGRPTFALPPDLDRVRDQAERLGACVLVLGETSSQATGYRAVPLARPLVRHGTFEVAVLDTPWCR